MRAAHILIDIAARLLPAHRHLWAQAMRHEILAVEDPRAALAFALGCLWAAAAERIAFMKPVVTMGRLLLGSVTALYALLFAAPLFFEIGHPERLNPEWPWLMPWQAGMAATHLAAALFLIFWRTRPFYLACAAAALAALPLPVIGWAYADNRPMAWAWPILPVILLTLSAAALAWLDHRTLKPARS